MEACRASAGPPLGSNLLLNRFNERGTSFVHEAQTNGAVRLIAIRPAINCQLAAARCSGVIDCSLHFCDVSSLNLIIVFVRSP
jgi:hypothetical protein